MTGVPNEAKILLDKIKTRGYYKIRFVPSTPLNGDYFRNMSSAELYQFFINAVVSLRGWDYPHFPTSDIVRCFYRIMNGHEAFTEFGYMKEVWRMMDSGQFIHYKAFCMDWGDEDDIIGNYSRVPPMIYFNFIDCIYVITEVFVFARNLFLKDMYKEDISVKITIELNNIMDRKLIHNDPRRAPIIGEHICRVPSFIKEITINKNDAILNHLNLAMDYIDDIHRIYNWFDFSTANIRQIQEGLLNRTF